MADPREKPNSIPWPPIIYGGLAIAAILLDMVLPLPGWSSRLAALAGTVLFFTGLAIDVATLVFFVRRKANFLPHRAATELITTGPFRYSRNPIYVGNTLTLSGAGLVLQSTWLIVAAALSAVLVHHLAVLREERHLAAKFGASWQDYASRTPRWLW
jgi:protein-S-isoprenylcysteine O-methyltransferase Ste14